MIICCGIDPRIELYHLDSLALTSSLPTLIFTVAVKGDSTPRSPSTTASRSVLHTYILL